MHDGPRAGDDLPSPHGCRAALCEHDLEGIVAKRKGEPYLTKHATWLKIRMEAETALGNAY
jgi:ATP-dependent DNA ligase